MFKNKDTSLIILSKLNDKDLLSTCMVNKDANKICQDQNFWRNRFISRYGEENFNFMKDKVKNWRIFMLSLIRYIDLGKGDLNKASEFAAEEGNINVIDFLIFMGEVYESSLFFYAARGGHKNMIDFIISKDLGNSLDLGIIMGAAEGGHKDLVDFFSRITDNFTHDIWSLAMGHAAGGGHKDLIEYFISKGANDWNYALVRAITGRHKELIEYFINKGANEWNDAMFASISIKDIDLVKFFIEKGANNWEGGLRIAKETGDKKMIDFFQSKINNL